MKRTSNYKKFLLLWTGELISSIGGGLTSFGLGVYVFQKTGSAGGMASVSLSAFLPTLLLSPLAGVLADRYDRRLLMIIGDGLSVIGLLYILVCMHTGEAGLYQICAGVLFSGIFSSLLEPSYRATVTDLLTRDEYAGASGMMSIAGSARYLVSPILAGLLLVVGDVKLLLMIDICTFLLTIVCTAIVRRSVIAEPSKKQESLRDSFRDGWRTIASSRGIQILIVVSAFMTCFMGVMQTLAGPMILSFQSSRMLGIAETFCACGMLVSGILIGIARLRKNFTKILSVSLVIAGLSMIGFGCRENIILICGFGFVFFFSLPFANSGLDYLIRTNIDAEKQGRAWGLIGFLTQIGYVAAYGTAGRLADGMAAIRGITVGRGAARVIMIAGGMLAALALTIPQMKEVRKLEDGAGE